MYSSIIAITLCLVTGFSSEARDVKGDTGHEILEWSPKSQRSFLATSMNMAGAIATQARPDIAKCIGEWYPADADIREKRHMEMIETMKKFPEYHPSAIVLFTVQEACGEFKDAKS